MSEELDKNAQDAKLNPEELDKVSGGVVFPDIPDHPRPKCLYCGSENIDININSWTLFCKDCKRAWSFEIREVDP